VERARNHIKFDKNIISRYFEFPVRSDRLGSPHNPTKTTRPFVLSSPNPLLEILREIAQMSSWPFQKSFAISACMFA
jgi:hypothetical protein